MRMKILNKLFLDKQDYFFVLGPKDEWNETGRFELHHLNSESAVMVGYWRIFRGLAMDWFFKTFMY